MSKYQIEKNIPVPPKKWSHCRWLNILETMKPGDSLLFDSVQEANSFRVSAGSKGYEVTQRKLEGGKYRIWLVRQAAGMGGRTKRK
jgi:hypothetical protein